MGIGESLEGTSSRSSRDLSTSTLNCNFLVFLPFLGFFEGFVGEYGSKNVRFSRLIV